jgi:hypothetical protein
MSIYTKAAGFAAGYGTLALAWTILGRGFPYGPGGDPDNDATVLRGLTAEVGAPLFAGVMLVTAVVMLIMNGTLRPSRPARTALLTYAWVVAFALVIVVPDSQVLTLAGYTPILIIGAPFGYPPVEYSEIFTWTLINQLVVFAGGVLLALAALRWQRDTAGGSRRSWATPEAAARWGRWAVGVAVAVPAGYAAIRLAWFAGIPLGIPREFLHDMQDNGMVIAGAGLGGFALVGAILTLGLVQRWGEVFPRWMIGLAGRPVPVKLATVPAGLVALAVTAASLALVTSDGFFTAFVGEPSLATLPMAFFPLWGVALGTATVAYHLRRRARPGLVQAPKVDAY